MSRDRRKKQRSHDKDAKRRAIATLRHQVRDQFGSKSLVFDTPSDRVKISEVVNEFIKPYVSDVKDRQDYEKLLSLAMIAWNAALLPQPQRELDSMLTQVPEQYAPDLRLTVTELIERKQKHFAADRREIMSFRVDDLPDGSWYLTVASSLEPVPEGRPTNPWKTIWAQLRSLWS